MKIKTIKYKDGSVIHYFYSDFPGRKILLNYVDVINRGGLRE